VTLRASPENLSLSRVANLFGADTNPLTRLPPEIRRAADLELLALRLTLDLRSLDIGLFGLLLRLPSWKISAEAEVQNATVDLQVSIPASRSRSFAGYLLGELKIGRSKLEVSARFPDPEVTINLPDGQQHGADAGPGSAR
jgi:hypothetical protein